MADFDKAYADLDTKEGGYVNHPNDRGRRTIFGISERFHGYLALWVTLNEFMQEHPNARPAEINDFMRNNLGVKGEVRRFYRKMWDAMLGDEIPSQKIATELFEQVVNLDYRRPFTWLQKVVYSMSPHIQEPADQWCDGYIVSGGSTMKNLLNLLLGPDAFKNEDQIVEALNAFQRVYYVEEMCRYPKQRDFKGGWFTRSYY